MLNEFAPIAENDEFTDRLRESIVVRIPTRAIIPKAIIRTVKVVLSRFDRMDIKEILKFSFINAIFLKYWLDFFTIIKFGTANYGNQSRTGIFSLFLTLYNH